MIEIVGLTIYVIAYCFIRMKLRKGLQAGTLYIINAILFLKILLVATLAIIGVKFLDNFEK